MTAEDIATVVGFTLVILGVLGVIMLALMPARRAARRQAEAEALERSRQQIDLRTKGNW